MRRWGLGLLVGFFVVAMPPLTAVANVRPGAQIKRLSFSFEPNRGQTDSRVKFLSRGPGYTLFLTPSEAVLALREVGKEANAGKKLEGRGARRESFITQVLRLKLIGANLHARIEGVDSLPGKSNYFIGDSPNKWRTDIPTYARVRYRDVYPGIDLVYYESKQRQLEYDFILSPGAKPDAIKLRFEGAKSLALNRDGDVVATLPDGGKVTQHLPAIYQERDGKRERIEGKSVLRGKDTVGFRFTRYDKSRAVYVDPGLAYSTYLGGNCCDYGQAIAVDSAGNAYVTGYAGSVDFPTTSARFQGYGGGASDAFVAKVTPDGTGLIYSTFLGGNGGDSGNGIAVDSAGSAYVIGFTNSANFPTTTGAFLTVYPGGNDAFVAKLSIDGSGLAYSTYLGEAIEGFAAGLGIALDSSGSAYVTGSTSSSSFPTTSGAFQLGLAGESNAFVTKLNANGTELVYSTYLGGDANDSTEGIAIDLSGNAYVTGITNSVNFPTTNNAFQPSYPSGGDDVFVTKLNSTGSRIIYSTFLGGNLGLAAGASIAVDPAGFAYVTGDVGENDSACTAASTPQSCCTGHLVGICKFPTTAGVFQPSYGGGPTDAFAAKFDPSQSGSASLIYSTFLGGSGNDDGYGIAVDPSGDTYLTGETWSPNFPVTADAFQTTDHAPGSDNAFVAKLTSDGSGLIYSTYLGGSANMGNSGDIGYGIATAAGFAYVTGLAASPDFPTTLGAFQTGLGGGSLSYNGFVTKLALPTTSATVSPTPTLEPTPPATPTQTASPSPTFTVTMTLTATATPTSTMAVTPTATSAATPVPAVIKISPGRVLFGKHSVETTTEKYVKIKTKKSNQLPVLIEAVTVTGGDYAWDSGASSCTGGEQLAPGQSCAIAIKFTPSSVTKGQADTGELIVATDAETVKPPGGLVMLKGGGK